jgi:gamma-glutamyltranspeptidase/glutathione hydrolase
VIDRRPWVPVPLARGTHGAVVAPHHLATAAGLGILRQGGSAVDAAIAANAVLAVVTPESCGLGGDAFWLIWDAAERRQVALNGSGRSAATADPAPLLAAGLDRVPLQGPLSITVPGAVRSWGDAHRRHGRLSPDAILAPAIELARSGFAAYPALIEAIESMAGVAHALFGPDAGFLEVFLSDGRPPRPGERVRLPALATTLETLAGDGFDCFYDGDLGERQAIALAEAGSAIRADDLRSHTSTWGTPIAVDYRGVRATSHPPNSSGIVALEILGILSRFEPPPRESFGPDGVTDPRWIHLGVEAAKLAMADRARHLTDPDAHDVPVATLLDPAYHAELAARIDPDRASRPSADPLPPGGGTIYLATVDGDGNAVSLIQSICWHYGSGVVDPGTGIAYQNRGAYFSCDSSRPNVLAPSKRTLHTLLPGMLFRDGRDDPWIVVGAMGLDAQPQIHAQFVSAVVDGGLDIRTAVAAPRWYAAPPDHYETPTDVHLETRHRSGVADALRDMGHDLGPARAFDPDLGHEHAIELVDGGPSAGGSVAATTDPRSDGLPAVW